VNPQLNNGNPKVGQVVLIPPFNGTRLEVPQGATWRDIAKAYGIRADVLFEVNGCQAKPSQVFIPGIAGRPALPSGQDTYTGLNRWPLDLKPSIGLDYGWQPDKQNPQNRFFHSGIDLLAPVDTPVLAAAAGTVLLVSQEGPYGFLVVLDHGNGRQTRYAQLSRFAVQIGERVQAGQILGQVGVTGKPDIPQPHLHFEVRFQSPVGWVAQDPKLHLPKATSVGF
jgi:murein DD-endopeptidase MepM/ murein hydrolase activator NlpD